MKKSNLFLSAAVAGLFAANAFAADAKKADCTKLTGDKKIECEKAAAAHCNAKDAGHCASKEGASCGKNGCGSKDAAPEATKTK